MVPRIKGMGADRTEEVLGRELTEQQQNYFHTPGRKREFSKHRIKF